ncbi:PhnA domain-containing protein [Mangrovivirga sp. M17]|uniref:PhnA domain-containing protein n=1 Tax=Mangrovivirga halotolerans TaxID=2993936 RepID=A0ABT3RNI4_9BACT|nr:alkylphosphonate utilization protein [Mangrovivirga halotolerans]MCX2743369.1 PhnA domain-containing protein [Mangrovivirga halotolerans]
MDLKLELLERSENKCELCEGSNPEHIYLVPPDNEESIDKSIILCNSCFKHIDDPASGTINHWRSLGNTMWSPTPAVQVVAWRTLNKLKSENWAVDLLNTIYLDEPTMAWAKDSGNEEEQNEVIHKDSNGATLEAGDTVILTKDLNVSGAGFTAKRGTAVRNILLVDNNPDQIEGKVNGQQIVILTKFVKKSTK